MKFTLTIDCTSDAFDGPSDAHRDFEIARILHEIARYATTSRLSLGTHRVHDVKGNRCGDWALTSEVWTEEELTDLIGEALSDSIDMDWSSTIGAKAVIRALRDNKLLWAITRAAR